MRAVFLDPGRLRTELILQAPSGAPDGAGGFTEGWSEVGTVFALVEPVSVQTPFGADQGLAETTHRITVRARGGLASGMRFVKGARTFAILAVHDPDESGRFLVCRTRETRS